MNVEFLNQLSSLKNLDTDDTEELVVATYATVKAGFQIGADKRVTLIDATYLLPVFGPIQDAVDNGSDASRELGIMENQTFDEIFERAAANFDIQDDELEHDIKGITKGVFHGYRTIARINRRKREQAA